MKTVKNITFLLYFVLVMCHHNVSIAGESAVVKRNNFSFNIDNDCFMVQNKDKDYTYSLGLNYTQKHKDQEWLVHKPLILLNKLFYNEYPWTIKATNIGLGMYGFTPRKKLISTVDHNDRPYASINYLSLAGLYLSHEQNTMLKSSLTLGLLGLTPFQNIQNAYHKHAGFNSVEGWSNQIARGGELTFKYALEVQKALKTHNKYLQLIHSYETSIGFITELSLSMHMRLGRIFSPWWQYQPNGINYGGKKFTFPFAFSEGYFKLGVTGKIRGYNSFLQSQIKKSPVTITSDKIKPFIIGAWVGYTQKFKQGFSIDYQVNFQSSEINYGKANRSMTWGSFVLSQSW